MTQDFYQAFILPYAKIIIKICRAYTHTQQDYEDSYQEVCLQIWRSHDNFNEQCQWSTWIYRVALNVCLTLLKKHKKKQVEVASATLPEQAIEDCHDFDNQDIHQLYQAIRQLSEVDRAVILLYLEEYSYQQIAEIIGTNGNNIGVRIARIKKRLNQLLILED